MRKRTTLALLTLLVASALVLPAVGGAAAVERIRERFGGPYSLAVPCDPYGHAFDVLVEGDDRGSITDVLDESGTLIREELHISLTEANTNSVTGKTLSLKGHVHIVFDYLANTRTLTGIVFMGRTTEGKAFQDTGRIVITLDKSVATFVAGPHEVFFGGGIDRMACEALAGP